MFSNVIGLKADNSCWVYQTYSAIQHIEFDAYFTCYHRSSHPHFHTSALSHIHLFSVFVINIIHAHYLWLECIIYSTHAIRCYDDELRAALDRNFNPPKRMRFLVPRGRDPSRRWLEWWTSCEFSWWSLSWFLYDAP